MTDTNDTRYRNGKEVDIKLKPDMSPNINYEKKSISNHKHLNVSLRLNRHAYNLTNFHTLVLS